jgi:hypothetical protein
MFRAAHAQWTSRASRRSSSRTSLPARVLQARLLPPCVLQTGLLSSCVLAACLLPACVLVVTRTTGRTPLPSKRKPLWGWGEAPYWTEEPGLSPASLTLRSAASMSLLPVNQPLFPESESEQPLSRAALATAGNLATPHRQSNRPRKDAGSGKINRRAEGTESLQHCPDGAIMRLGQR